MTDHLIVEGASRQDSLAVVEGLSAMLDSLHIAACLFDDQDRTILWNRSFLRLFPEHDGFVFVGEPYAENLRRFYRGRLGPGEIHAIDQCIAEGLARHRIQAQPYVFEHRGGWLRVASKPIAGLGRMRIWTQIAAPDTPDTFSGQGDEGDGRSEVGADGRIIRGNARLASLFRLGAPNAAIGRTHAELLAAAWSQSGGVPARVLQTLAEGERFVGVPFELSLPADRWLRVLQDRHSDGRVASTFADVSATKRLQADLSAARETADRANRAKDDLLATVSHELRTPLNGVLGVLSVLETQPLPEEAARHVGLALRAMNGLLHLVEDILSYSRGQNPQATTMLEAIDPAQLVRELVELLTPEAQAKGVALRAEIEPGLPGLVRLDAARLRQVLVNLTANALKFTEQGAVTIRLGRDMRQDGNALRLAFAVADTGIGIPASAHRAIFLPRVQAGPEIAPRFGGSGLGLAICRTLVQAMGGEITVTSIVGDGSRFAFAIPCTEVPRFAPATPEALPSLPVLRVLVVDDLAVNREVARILLERLGQTVILAGQDEEALATLETPPDLLLLDLDMPGLGGIGLLAAMRAAAPGHRMRAIAVTGHIDDEHRKRCREAGFDGFLTKPLSLRTLAEAITRIMPAAPAPRRADSA